MLIHATKDYMNGLDAKAEAMKNEILCAESNYPRYSKSIYYVSNSGDDKNDGKSESTPFRTIARLNEEKMLPGSVALFKRGDTWREQLVTQAGVTYSAYGDGRKPRLFSVNGDGSGAENWKKTEYPNVYVYAKELDPSVDIGLIVYNGGEAISYRRYLYEENNRPDGIGKFEGFDDFNADLQFWFRKSDTKLFVYSLSGNPGERFSTIDFATFPTVIKIEAPNVTIDNLCVRYSGSHCISWDYTMNLEVRNCEIGYDGGCLLGTITRFGNGIQIYFDCCGFNIHDNYIYQMYDTGLTFQSWDVDTDAVMQNISFADNLIEYCYWSIEYVSRGEYKPNNRITHAVFRGNFLRHAGYNWGDIRHESDHGSHIQGWQIENPADHFVIENNILDRSRHLLINCGASKKEYLPVMRGNTYIQTEGERIGCFGVLPESGKQMKMYYATENSAKEIEEEFPEENPTVVLVNKEFNDYKNHGVRVFVKD